MTRLRAITLFDAPCISMRKIRVSRREREGTPALPRSRPRRSRTKRGTGTLDHSAHPAILALGTAAGSVLVGGAPGELGMHDHLAQCDELERFEQPLAADILGEKTAGTRLQHGGDILGILRRRQNDSLHAGIGRDYFAHKGSRGRDRGLNARQPDAASLRAQIGLQLLVERCGDTCRPKSGFAEELPEPIMEQGRWVRYNNGKNHDAYAY